MKAVMSAFDNYLSEKQKRILSPSGTYDSDLDGHAEPNVLFWTAALLRWLTRLEDTKAENIHWQECVYGIGLHGVIDGSTLPLSVT